jgi:uncharacterized protein
MFLLPTLTSLAHSGVLIVIACPGASFDIGCNYKDFMLFRKRFGKQNNPGRHDSIIVCNEDIQYSCLLSPIHTNHLVYLFYIMHLDFSFLLKERNMNLTELMDCIPHLREILHIVREAFEDYDDPAHDISHTFRVTENASEIASRERCDLQKAVIAALLHDIKRPQEALTGIDHAESGAEYALGLLPTMEFNFSFISEVSQAIRSHRYSGGLTPTSVTGKILQDADRLDAIGAVAIARVVAYSGKVGTSSSLSPIRSVQLL